MQECYDLICKEVQKLKRRYDETDPFRLCQAMGISVLLSSMGKAQGSVKGFFLVQSRIRCIAINSELSDDLARIICAHELGHAVLHWRWAGKNGFCDSDVFTRKQQFENEANAFAAELLLDDEEVYTVLKESDTFFDAASELRVPFEILDFKFRIMKQKGYEVGDSPVQVRSNWMMDVPDGAGESFG